MRIDKYLQVSRIIKRRAVAKEIIEKNRVQINEKIAKPATDVEVGDLVKIKFGDVQLTIKILDISEKVKKESANEMYEIIKREESEKNE
ncbi:RNA-binding S4 domain-containing protein [Erysipelotrichaceae bacterium OttesenSCG-928-M19]|nr:RNA-binding S4 domain-containing protein [Erysipelotrichaceae bacterium OttesenSCG-928-M19]